MWPRLSPIWVGNPKLANRLCQQRRFQPRRGHGELLAQVAQKTKGDEEKTLKKALKEVEAEEDEHLYHTAGWARELWIQSLGLPAVIPPPEEEKEVKTAIGAARAKQSRKKMLSHH